MRKKKIFGDAPSSEFICRYEFMEVVTRSFLLFNSGYRLICFDNADPELQSSPFEQRYINLLANIKIDHPFVISNERNVYFGLFESL